MNKRGCFIKIVGFGTVFIAVIAYLIQTNSFESFIKPILNIVTDEITNKVKDNLKYVKPSVEKDSLMTELSDFIKDRSHTIGKGEDKTLNLVMSKITVFAQDSIIDKIELQDLRELIKMEKRDEGSKKK